MCQSVYYYYFGHLKYTQQYLIVHFYIVVKSFLSPF